MDLIGEEQGRLTRAASWFRATPAEVAGLAVLLACALFATGVLAWSAFGRPLPTPTAADGAASASGVGSPAEVGVAGGPDGADAAGAGDPHEAPEGHAAGDVTSAPAAAPPDATGEVTVHVAGAVAAPGVVVLPAGARVTDAIEAAGGLLPDADPSRVNLARPVADGEQLLVLREGEEPPPPVAGSSVDPAAGGASPGASSGASSAAGGDGRVDVNTATVEQLETLPGVGPAIAGRIVQHREQHGPFRTPGDLRDVSGIGEKRFQDLADLVTVG
jgi:competence protein ComEA